ncbi:MAG: DNA-processing protein DprA [Firmicutes bacterium]|nr:DNA-processing protein DprA [Bacillota bacterium]
MDEREAYLLLWLTVRSVKGIGLVQARSLIGDWKTTAPGATLSAGDWRERNAPPSLCQALVAAFRSEEPSALVARIRASGVSLVSDRDEHYPMLLKEIAAAPPFLFYYGTLPEKQLNVGIVGTRTCSAYGRKAAFEIASTLADTGVGVVSGLAYGVDKAAHEGALMGAGVTVAVLGSGVDAVYPREHRRLADQIVAARGCVMSEFLPWTGPQSYQFPQRNRIISGLSQAIVIIEAGERSGALITAAYALEQNRDVLAVPGSIFSDRSRGTNALIVEGARPVLSAGDVLDAIGYTGRSGAHFVQGEMTEWAGLPAIQQCVLAELSASERTLGELQEAAVSGGFSRRELFEAITALELASLIVHSEGTYAQATPKL